MKLIRTKLLKNGDCTDAALATASHLDYCSYRYKRSFDEPVLKNIIEHSILIFEDIISLIARLTHGIILYPLWIVYHIQIKKELIEFHGIEKLNDAAEEEIKELEDDRFEE